MRPFEIGKKQNSLIHMAILLTKIRVPIKQMGKARGLRFSLSYLASVPVVLSLTREKDFHIWAGSARAVQSLLFQKMGCEAKWLSASSSEILRTLPSMSILAGTSYHVT